MNKYKYIIIIVLLFCIFFCIYTICKKKNVKNDNNVVIEEKNKYYDIEFHRGGRDARPENTLYAFQYALENGATTIECDMQLTKDGQIVLIHNASLNEDITLDSKGNRIKNNTYFIHDMTLEELKSFNVGRMNEISEYYDLHGRTQVQTDAKIPTLQELFELIKASKNEDVKISIEAKYYSDPDVGIDYKKNPDKDILLNEFLKLVKKFGFEQRVILQSFDWDVLVKMKMLDSEIETIALYNEQKTGGSADSKTLWINRNEPSPWLGGINIHDFDNNPIKAAHYLGIDNVSPYYEIITKEQVDEAHSYGMKVVPWTVNNKEDMERLYNMNVDGIITDRPWVLREFLILMGEKIPQLSKVNLPYHLFPEHIE